MNDNSKQGGQEQVWLYFIRRTMRLGYAGTTTNLQIVLNIPKNPHLNQALPPQKKYLPNFATQKKFRNQKFQTQKSPSVILVT